MKLASVPDQSLAARKALGVACFGEGRVAFKQFFISTAGGVEVCSYLGLSTYTFKNGDALTLKFTGAWTVEGHGGDYEVISGAGAFEGATGTGRFAGSAYQQSRSQSGSLT